MSARLGGRAGGRTSWRPPPLLPDIPARERRLRTIGLVVWIVAMLAGGALDVLFALREIAGAGGSADVLRAISQGALFALVPLCVYLIVPTVLDRYDPEPWWCRAMAFLWGAVAATGFSGLVNSTVRSAVSAAAGPRAGELWSTVVSAPLTEELWKGLAVLGIFYFLRREFDGVVDGIIYSIFCALGFAAVENIAYYARAGASGDLGATFLLRGVLAPWGHPLYTSMTGIGFGISRESSRRWVRWLAPAGGYFAGVALHAIWNLVPALYGEAFWALIPLWTLFVLAFFGIVVALVLRKGRTIRRYLRDEVLLGHISQEELELVCSPVGRLKCTFGWRGATGRRFIRAAARLALSKWHTLRAMRGKRRTVSADYIVPMREEIARLRGELAAKMPR